MATFEAGLLNHSAAQGASQVARSYLDDAAAAAARLDDHADTEALHDFRVAIRRLRVAVAAYADLHDGISKKQRRRLRKLARATNAARDAEVQLAWFRDRTARFTRAQRTALAPVRARIRTRRRREQVRSHTKLQRKFQKLNRKLRSRLTAVEAGEDRRAARFGPTAAAALVQHAADLSARLGGVTSVSQTAELHETRIAAKKLRYLLEPLQRGLPSSDALLDDLKELQDLLGEIHDAHVLEDALARAGVSEANELLRDELASLFTTLQEDWLSAGPNLQRAVDGAARQLQASRARPRPRRPAARRRDRQRRENVTV
jgi:CHAD domain-containing protein